MGLGSYPNYGGNTQDTIKDIPGDLTIANAADYNAHDSEILSHQTVLVLHSSYLNQAVRTTSSPTFAGGTFTGFPFTPSSAPSSDYHVANKKYVDDQISGENYWDRSAPNLTTYYSADNWIPNASGIQMIGTEPLPFASGVFNSIKVTSSPTASNDATPKSYVDSQISGENHWDLTGTNLHTFLTNVNITPNASGSQSVGLVGTAFSAGYFNSLEAGTSIYSKNYTGSVANLSDEVRTGDLYLSASGIMKNISVESITASGNVEVAGLAQATIFTDGTASITGGVIENATNTNWDAAYAHSIDNSQAHTDYLLNTSDTIAGDLTPDSSGSRSIGTPATAFSEVNAGTVRGDDGYFTNLYGSIIHDYTIDHASLASLTWSTAGHTIDADIIPTASGAQNVGTQTIAFSEVNAGTVRGDDGYFTNLYGSIIHDYTIDHASLANLAWSTAGHTIDTTLDLSSNDIISVKDLYVDASGIFQNISTESITASGNIDVAGIIEVNTDGRIYNSSNDLYIENVTSNKDIIFRFNDGGINKELKIDASANKLTIPNNFFVEDTLTSSDHWLIYGDGGDWGIRYNSNPISSDGLQLYSGGDYVEILDGSIYAKQDGKYTFWQRTSEYISTDDNDHLDIYAGDSIDLNSDVDIEDVTVAPTASGTVHVGTITTAFASGVFDNLKVNATPTQTNDAAPKSYVDAQVGAENFWDRSGTELSTYYQIDNVVPNASGTQSIGTQPLAFSEVNAGTVRADTIIGTTLTDGTVLIIDGAITNATNTNWDAAYTHVSNDGSDHSYIDQDVTSGSTPTFTGTNITDVASINVADTTDASCYVALFESATGTLAIKTDQDLLYDASSGRLTCVTLTVGEDIGISADRDILELTSNLLTINGDLLVENGDIGLTADTDLIQLAANALTVNGATTIDYSSSAAGDPNLRLSVGASTGAVPRLTFNADQAADGSATSYIKFFNNGATPGSQISSLRGSTDVKGDLRLHTSNVTQLLIDEDGHTTLTADLRVDGGDIGITADTNLLQLAIDSVTVNGEINSVGWTDYGGTSTVVGWAATPTKNIWYKKVGNLVYVNFYITGTSNATNATFTLPYTSSNSTNFNVTTPIKVVNAGVASSSSGMLLLLPNTSTALLYSTWSVSAFTASDEKTLQGQFWFEAQ